LVEINIVSDLVSSAIAGSMTRNVAVAVLRWRWATWSMSICYIIEAMRRQGSNRRGRLASSVDCPLLTIAYQIFGMQLRGLTRSKWQTDGANLKIQT
jgi:hypothetical protein